MFWDVWRRDAKGYLYYLSTYWGRDATPWDRPSFMLPGVTYRYRQGDGYFFYPPQRAYNPVPPILDTAVTSIRWELLREGAEDYDTLRLLEDLTAAAEKRGLEAARAGREALSQARSLAESMAGSLAGGGIRHLQFTAREEQAGAIPGTGWSFSAQEGWLHHAAAPCRLAHPLPRSPAGRSLPAEPERLCRHRLPRQALLTLPGGRSPARDAHGGTQRSGGSRRRAAGGQGWHGRVHSLRAG